MSDPRVRLLYLALYLALASKASRVESLSLLLALPASVVAIARLWRACPRFLRFIVPSALFYGAVLYFSGGLRAAAVSALRLLDLASGAFVYFQTTSPERFRKTLLALRLPKPFVFVFSSSFQFVEAVSSRVAEIHEGLRARGIPLDRIPGFARWLPAFLLPVMVDCFRTAERLAETMEVRGFSAGTPRHDLRWRGLDTARAIAATGLFACLWLALP